MIASQVCGEFITFHASAMDALMDTGFTSFVSLAGCHGLAKEDPETRTLDVLAVNATRPGTGQFRRFVAQAQASYDRVRFWHELYTTPHSSQALKRYGFTPWMVVVGNESVNGWEWVKI